MTSAVPNEHGVYADPAPAAELRRKRLKASIYVLEIRPGEWASDLRVDFRCGDWFSFSGPLMDRDLCGSREEAVLLQTARARETAEKALAITTPPDEIDQWTAGSAAHKLEARQLLAWAEGVIAEHTPAPLEQLVMAL